MRHGVVRRVQPLALELRRDHAHRAVELVAHHAPHQVLAGDLPALEVEGVAVAVVRGGAEHADVAVVLDPAHLPVVRDVAPDQELADAVPRRALGPERAGPQALDRAVGLGEAIEGRLDRDDVRVPEIRGRRALGAEVARRAGDRARRRDRPHVLGERGAGAERHGRAGARADPAEEAAPIETFPLPFAHRLGAVGEHLVLLPKHLLLPP